MHPTRLSRARCARCSRRPTTTTGERSSARSWRASEERGAWWSALGDWARPAMLAAAVALIAATVLLSRSKSADAAVAYSAMSEEQYPVVESTTAAANVPAATVHMLLDH